MHLAKIFDFLRSFCARKIPSHTDSYLKMNINQALELLLNAVYDLKFGNELEIYDGIIFLLPVDQESDQSHFERKIFHNIHLNAYTV